MVCRWEAGATSSRRMRAEGEVIMSGKRGARDHILVATSCRRMKKGWESHREKMKRSTQDSHPRPLYPLATRQRKKNDMVVRRWCLAGFVHEMKVKLERGETGETNQSVRRRSV